MKIGRTQYYSKTMLSSGEKGATLNASGKSGFKAGWSTLPSNVADLFINASLYRDNGKIGKRACIKED